MYDNFEEQALKKPRNLIITTPSSSSDGGNILASNVLKLLENLDDDKIRIQVANRVQNTGFTDEIRDAFVANHGAKKDSITIENYVGVGAHRNSHFIINYEEKKWHAKPALHGKNYSLGTPFNEFAHYKLNEYLGIGPRSYGFVSKEGVVMILTEDLNYRSLNGGINKEVSFSDFSDKVTGEEKLKSIPNRDQDSVHRCVAQIAINLLSLSDIENNPGNTGIKSSKINDDQIKEKLFIVDFTLNDYYIERPFLDIKTYADSLALILKPSSKKPLSEPLSKKDKDPITPIFKESPEVIGAALKKLFLDDNGEIKKFENNIIKAFGEAGELLGSYKIEDPKTGDTETVNEDFKEPNLSALTAQKVKLLESLNTFLENEVIITFLKEAGPKHKEEQLEKSKIKTKTLTPKTDVYPTNSSGQSIGIRSGYEKSPSPS